MKHSHYLAVPLFLCVGAACARGPETGTPESPKAAATAEPLASSARPPEAPASMPRATAPVRAPRATDAYAPAPRATEVFAPTPRAFEGPAPTPRVIEVPAGATLSLIMETAMSSKTSQPEDPIEARLATDLLVNGRVVAPAGSAVRGQVTEAVPSGRVKTRARLAFVFDSIVIGGNDRSMQTRAVDITAEDTHTRDAVTVGGATAAGAVIGGIADGGKGAGIGALIGAGAGAGVVLIDKGKNVTIPAGTALSIELTQALRIRG